MIASEAAATLQDQHFQTRALLPKTVGGEAAGEPAPSKDHVKLGNGIAP